MKVNNKDFDWIFIWNNSILELKTCEQQYESIKIENEEEVARYYKLKKKLETVQGQMSVMMNEPKYLLPFLQPGRLVTVRKYFPEDFKSFIK
jgi:ATP-dependent RNA helicase DOB1